MVKVCHPLPCTRQAKPGLPWEMRPLAATCRGSGHPITLCDLQLARRHARGHQVHRYHEQGRQDGPLLHGGARYGRRAAIACCTAVDGCCCARIRRSFARCRPSLGVIFGAIESASRAARRDVQLAAHGARGEERGRDARAIGWACRGTCFFHLRALIYRDHIRLRE